MTLPPITERQLAHILAGLRLFQRECCTDGNGDICDIATDGGEYDLLTDDEIDILCQRINRI